MNKTVHFLFTPHSIPPSSSLTYRPPHFNGCVAGDGLRARRICKSRATFTFILISACSEFNFRSGINWVSSTHTYVTYTYVCTYVESHIACTLHTEYMHMVNVVACPVVRRLVSLPASFHPSACFALLYFQSRLFGRRLARFSPKRKP